MATYFHGGSEIQENMQTLYLMNPNYSYIAAYSDAHNPHSHSSMLIPHALPQGTTPHAPPHQPPPGHPFIAIPLSDNPGRPSSSPHPDHDHHHASLHGSAVSRVHHNLWSSPSPTGQVQGLSLSLSPHQQNAGGASVVTVASGARGVIFGSKYLKATQELLDEVVSVGYEKGESSRGVHKEKGKGPGSAGEPVADGVDVAESSGGSKVAAEQLSPAQRQELQMKKAKLLNMLNEVEQRYRQYHTQMEAVASTFKQAAGMGSAKSYTSLALKTISRQFRCLKDGITSQIKETSKSLGEENQDGVKIEGGGIGSRLRLVDHQLRQQKALQQLGMMASHNAWRPQRGLPERAVSVLRAWLFEHFLHPYPKDSDKHMLAKQTGLTRSQVSNWFINARVRLWKPMVEEMYLEEVKAQEKNGDNSDTNNNNNTNNASLSKNDHNKDQQQQQRQNDRGISPTANQTHPHPDSQMNNFISSDMDSLIGSATRSPKKHRTNSDIHSSPSSILSMDMEMKPLDHQTHHPTGFNPVYILNNDMPGRFNPDHLTGAYGNNNGVSLTLGLPHCDNLSPPPPGFLPADQGMELGSRLDGGAPGGDAGLWAMSMGQSSHPVATSNGFDTIDVQSRKRFAAHQLLHDFVA